MAENKRDHFSSTSNTNESDISSSVVQNGAFFVAPSDLRNAIINEKAETVSDGETIAATRNLRNLVDLYVGQTGIVDGSPVHNIQVSGVYGGLGAPHPGTLLVENGGKVLGVNVDFPGAVASAFQNGEIYNATAQSGGSVWAGNQGIIDGGTVLGNGALVASAAGTLLAGDAQHNISGGVAVSGGIVSAQNGGTANGVVAAGGTIIAGNGGVVSDAIVASGAWGLGFNNTAGSMIVSGGGRVNNVTVQGDAGATVLGGGSINGGAADGIITETGSGAVVSNVELRGTYHALIPLPFVQKIFGGYSGGALVVSASGAVASNITVDGGAIAAAMVSGATILGGTAIGTNGPWDGHKSAGIIYAGKDGAVVAGATALSRGIIEAGASGATAGGTVTEDGSIVVVSGGVISGATILAGGTLYSESHDFIGFGTSGQGVVFGATYNNIDFDGDQIFGFSNGTMSNVTANQGVAVGVRGSGAVIYGATATGNMALGTDGAASIDAFDGGTIYNGTAEAGGIIAAGGVSVLKLPWDNGGVSLLSGARIMNGGLGVVGGNNNLTVTKHGTQATLNGAGRSSDAVVDAGGILDINGSGAEIGGKIAGTAVVESGGTISGAVFSGAAENGLGAGSGYVDSGGTADSNIVESGATLTFYGGIGSGNIAQAGGVIDVGAGGSWFLDPNNIHAFAGAGTYAGTVSDTHLKSGGIMSVTASGTIKGTAIKVDVQTGATLVVGSGGVVSNATIGAGDDKWAGDGGTVIDPGNKVGGYVANGGYLSGVTLEDGSGTGATVSEMGGLLRVEKGATVDGIKMGNFGQIEVISVNYGAGESVTYVNNSITLWSDGVREWGATLSGGPYSSGGFQVWDDDGTAVIVYDVCFLKGTLISTPNGEIEVQNLKEGDLIWAVENGKNVARPIRDLHRGRSSIDRSLPTDWAGWSVCVRAGAFGNDLPKRDLRVTPEHCFFFEGKFIPVRMLVNGSSIYYDTNLSDFEYFHFETEPHAVIRAEGVLTESWLNTKERRQSVNLSNGITRLDRIPSRTWERDAAAPLDVSPAFAEKLWNHFHVRALQKGVETCQAQTVALDKNPNLRLCLADGKEILPMNRRGNKYFFQLPAGIDMKEIYLKSKIFRPSEAIGPWIDDRRQLGVLIGRILVSIGEDFKAVDTHLYHANAQGWDVVENSPCRWTKGKALLPVLGSEEELRYGVSLIIDVLAGGPYLEQDEQPKMTVLSGASFG